ncbi:MAG TPA: hemerythrin domain-containing protein [Kofleriaceae bacterium]|nr:hemerythrin domain-containing protein [Kofleriaceae bacterium]
MLVSLGHRTSRDDVIDLLSECHLRIRKFIGLARQLARTPEVPADEAATVAGQVRRYFEQAFPLHVTDEDELISPCLAGHSPDVDAALATMTADHGAHAGAVDRLVAACAAIEREPATLAARAAELGEAAAELTAVVEPHLALEERTIFPALRSLTPDVRERVRTAMRERRQR